MREVEAEREKEEGRSRRLAEQKKVDDTSQSAGQDRPGIFPGDPTSPL